MGMIIAIRMMNGINSGAISGTQLQTLLGDSEHLGDFQQIITMPGACQMMAASSTAMTAVAASSTAMTAVAASSTAMTAVAASSTAMTAVAASSTAMTAVAASSTATNAISGNATANNIALGSSYEVGAYLNEIAVIGGATTNATLAAQATMTAVAASSTAMTAVWASNTATAAVFASATARLAIYNADTALAALQAAPTQVQTLITNATAALSSNTWSGAVNLVANGTKIIILRRYYSATEYDFINWTRGSVTSGVGNGPTAGSGGRTLYTSAAALGCTSGTYTSTGAFPGTNDATGNFVCAANGLRRDTANNGAIQYVYYIPV